MSSYQDAAPSLVGIQEKLEKAEKARKLEFQKRKGKCVDESLAKFQQNRQALSLKEIESQRQFKETLVNKLESAEKLRIQAIDSKVRKARRESTKID